MNSKVINEEIMLSPIGSVYKVEKNDISYLFPTSTSPIKIELFCPVCKEKRIFSCCKMETTDYYFNGGEYYQELALYENSNSLISYNFSCEYGHNMKISLITLGEGNIKKYGQYPSSMYYSTEINDGIFKILTEEEKEYYKLSIKSKNENLNIASLMYLRRVFESLINKAKKKSTTDFSGKKVKEIIKILVKEGLLNPMLSDNGYNVLYSILSDGIHNLSEDECKSQYPLLKSAIEIILEDEQYQQNLEKRKKKIGNLLSNTNSEK